MTATDGDQLALQTIILRVISDQNFRTLFTTDAKKAVESSGLHFSQSAKDALIANASHAAGLTAKMDNVHAAFFFFYHGGNS